MAQVYAARELGFVGNLKRYFVNPLRDPGRVLRLSSRDCGTILALLSLSFRLFGNVLAGEILIAMILILTQVAVMPWCSSRSYLLWAIHWWHSGLYLL